jgi:hypothetical protein
MNYLLYYNQLNENLPRQSTEDQLKRLRKISKGTDIGDKIAKTKGANLNYLSNPVDTGVESIEHHWKHNDPVKPVTSKSNE